MKKLKIKKKHSMPEGRDSFTMVLERCKCCGGMITCKCEGSELKWFCSDKDPDLACEHIDSDFSCKIGGSCFDKDGGKLNTEEADHKMRAMISYTAYEIFRMLCQFGCCIATGSDEVRRALTELGQMVNIVVYKENGTRNLYIDTKGSRGHRFLKKETRKGKMKKLL